MSRRHQVEVAIVIVALWLNYLLRLRGLKAQGYVGLPAILVGLVVAGRFRPDYWFARLE